MRTREGKKGGERGREGEWARESGRGRAGEGEHTRNEL